MRTTRVASVRVFALLFVSLLLLLGFSMLLGQRSLRWLPVLYAEENQPDAPGTISGVVRDHNADPLPGIYVTLYTHYTYDDSWIPLSQITTDGQGEYRFSLLSAGIYRVGVRDAEQQYSPLFYPNGGDVFDATDIVINGTQRNNIDFTLTTGSEITGVITATSDIRPATLVALLYQEIDGYVAPDGTYVNWSYVAQQSASISGTFAFRGLAADDYRLCAAAYGETSAWYECYDNVANLNDSETLTLGAGSAITDITMVIGDGADLGKISGRVTATEGHALAAIGVYVIDASYSPYVYYVAPTPVPVATATPASGVGVADPLLTPTPTATPVSVPVLPFSYRTQTDQDGHYELKYVNPGAYHILFYDSAGDYRYEYDDDVTFYDNAATLRIAQGSAITDVNATLQLGSHLTGTVTLLGQPAATTALTLLKYEDDSWIYVANASVDPFTGAYEFGALPAGRYRLLASAYITYPSFGWYYFSGFYGGKDWESASDIKLAANTTLANLDIDLSNGPHFDGAVSGHVTADGAPLPNVQVSLYAGCCYPYSPGARQTYAITDEEGRYTIGGLTNNAYQVRFEDLNGQRAALFYPKQPLYTYYDLNSYVFITDSHTTTGIDIDLPLGAAVQGRVYKPNGDAFSDLLIMAITQTVESSLFIFQETRTAEDGSYRLAGLYPGSYHVCAGSKQSFQYGIDGIECFGETRSTPWYLYGQTVTVAAGQTRNDVNILWGPEEEQYLPLIAR